MKQGLFSANYVSYKVETRPMKYEVFRRFSDFYWLRNILSREFPGYYIPPMARKGAKRSFDKDHITERMGDLNRFLEGIVQNEDLRTSVYTLSFLKCKDNKQFNKLKKNLNRLNSRISVREWIMPFFRILMGNLLRE